MSKDLRIGVVGVGAIGRTHIERINHQLQGGKVVACSDVNAEFGKSVADKYGCKFYADGGRNDRIRRYRCSDCYNDRSIS